MKFSKVETQPHGKRINCDSVPRTPEIERESTDGKIGSVDIKKARQKNDRLNLVVI